MRKKVIADKETHKHPIIYSSLGEQMNNISRGSSLVVPPKLIVCTSRSKGKGRPSILSSLSRYSLRTHNLRKMNCFSRAVSVLANWSCWGRKGGREGEGEGEGGGREGGRERGIQCNLLLFCDLNIPLLPFFSQLQYTPSYHGQFDHIYHMAEVGLV